MENMAMIQRLPNQEFWKNKNVLITGHSGFKGGWLTLWLHKFGANVTGISLAPETNPNLFSEANIQELCSSKFIDICNLEALKSEIRNIQPEIIIHLAAQPLVRRSYEQPIKTFDTNILGSINLLEAARNCNSIRTVVMVTTDKVYKNNEDGRSYNEDDHLGGHDPYSASKAASEIVIESYRKSFFTEKNISISTARAGNVIGGGDWSDDRLIPDAVKSWSANEVLEIRSPHSIRPWQHVLEPLNGYLILAEDTFQNSGLAGAYNFGPPKNDEATVKDLIEQAQMVYEKGEIIFIDSKSHLHEASLLSLNTEKAISDLSFTPKWSLKEAIQNTITWYKKFEKGHQPLSLCISDIENYEMTNG
jgi:CDP-glucose 4,6-dehydratase